MTSDGATPQTEAEPPAAWQGILDPRERIVWQGRPDQGFSRRGREHPAPPLFALFFAGFAVFWMSMAARSGGPFWMFGLIHFSVGLGRCSGRRCSAPRADVARTWYTLTDRRAFIATDLAFKGRDAQELPDHARHRDQTTGRTAAPRSISPGRRRRGNKGRSHTVPIGFERIVDGRARGDRATARDPTQGRRDT